MKYNEFLTKIIDDGIIAARQDYANRTDRDLLEGSVAGFEECRGKNPVQLSELYEEANKTAQKAMFDRDEHYWFWRGRALEIEWVCNCISAILYDQNLPVIIVPTCIGMMKAAEVMGITGKNKPTTAERL